MSEPGPPTVLTRTLYVRGLALVHLVAIASFWWQAAALVGDDGILPMASYLDATWRRLGAGAWLELPTVLWMWPTATALHALCGTGMVIALALLLGFPLEGPALLLLWATYLSLSSVGQQFMGFQWDALLVEATFTAMLVAQWLPKPTEPPRWAWWIQWWLVFRLMFFAGVVKLASGDPTWADWTALDVHFWTQPLPNPLSRWAHHWPGWLHQAGVGLTFLVELALPFAILLGRRGRLAAFASFVALMGMLAATGNYGFFPLLSVVLCLSLLDDGHLASVLPRRLVDHVGAAERRGTHLGLPVALAIVALSGLRSVDYRSLPGWGRQVVQLAAPFRTVNPYGLFAVMTTDRVEIVLEGSDDGGATWRELHLRHKPGPVDRVPTQVAPHMPRVDWQLWFASLGTCRQNPWVVQLLHRVADGSEAVEPLFVRGTFDGGHPELVRAVAWRYTFSAPGSDVVWDRERLGLYCPVVKRVPEGATGRSQ